jgi:hypothetical protein
MHAGLHGHPAAEGKQRCRRADRVADDGVRGAQGRHRAQHGAPVVHGIGHQPFRLAVAWGIQRPHAKPGLQQRGHKTGQVAGMALPAVQQQHRGAFAPGPGGQQVAQVQNLQARRTGQHGLVFGRGQGSARMGQAVKHLVR